MPISAIIRLRGTELLPAGQEVRLLENPQHPGFFLLAPGFSQRQEGTIQLQWVHCQNLTEIIQLRLAMIPRLRGILRLRLGTLLLQKLMVQRP